MNLHRLLDRLREWWRYPQPTRLQKALGYNTDVMNIRRMGRDLGTQDTWRYMQDHDLEDLRDFVKDIDLYHHVVQHELDQDLLRQGLVLEFGTATGRTLRQFARWLPNNTIWGFDSWQGLPEKFNDLPVGHFAQKLPKVRSNCRLIRGWFGARPEHDQSGIDEYTAEAFAQEHTEPIALLHLDADLYSSTKTVLDAFEKQIVPGTVILFNEYWNHATWKKHEFRAWQEHVKRHNIKYEYVAYASDHQEVAIRVLSKVDQ